MTLPRRKSRPRMGLRESSVIRDRAFLDWLRTQPCIFTGLRGNDSEAVDPAHIGQAGMGMKASDDLALPVMHRMHLKMHSDGEIVVFRKTAPDWLLREMLRAYARQEYAKYLASEKRTDGK